MVFLEYFDLEGTVEVVNFLAEFERELPVLPVFLVGLVTVDELFQVYFVASEVFVLFQQHGSLLPDQLHHALRLHHDDARKLCRAVLVVQHFSVLVILTVVLKKAVHLKSSVYKLQNFFKSQFELV